MRTTQIYLFILSTMSLWFEQLTSLVLCVIQRRLLSWKICTDDQKRTDCVSFLSLFSSLQLAPQYSQGFQETMELQTSTMARMDRQSMSFSTTQKIRQVLIFCLWAGMSWGVLSADIVIKLFLSCPILNIDEYFIKLVLKVNIMYLFFLLNFHYSELQNILNEPHQ